MPQLVRDPTSREPNIVEDRRIRPAARVRCDPCKGVGLDGLRGLLGQKQDLVTCPASDAVEVEGRTNLGGPQADPARLCEFNTGSGPTERGGHVFAGMTGQPPHPRSAAPSACLTSVALGECAGWVEHGVG